MKKLASILTFAVTGLLWLTMAGTASAESPQPFNNLTSFFSFPPALAGKWSLIQLPSDLRSGRGGFMYSRKAIVDNAGVSVSPKVAFIFEQVPPIPDALDAATVSDYVILYSLNVRTRWTIPTTIDKVYSPGDNLFPWKKAIGYKAHYNDNMEHTIFLVHGLVNDNGKTYGVQVIMDSTSSVFPEVETEFIAMLAQIGGGQ